MITIHFDGSCWPNPGGIAGYGAIIQRDGKEICRISEHLPAGDTSNNVAEYKALVSALEWVYAEAMYQRYGKSPSEVITEVVKCFGDSQLVIKQMWGWPTGAKRWKIKKGLYETNARHCAELLKRFRSITGTWVPRAENSLADELSRPVSELEGKP